MLHLIAYDITSAKRLRKIARICEDFGVRVEKSVFECDLKEKDFESMWKQLSRMVDSDEDRIIDYPIGLISRDNIREVGYCTHNEPQLTRIF